MSNLLLNMFLSQQDTIKKKLNNLNPYKSPGAEELFPRIKKMLIQLSVPLSLIFSKSFSDWKDAIIVPLHKKGKKCLLATIHQLVWLLLFVKSWSQSLKMIFFHTWLVTRFWQSSSIYLFLEKAASPTYYQCWVFSVVCFRFVWDKL